MTNAIRPDVARFLEHSATRKPTARGRLIFALDATASRQPTWDQACQLQAGMFAEAGGLEVQLVYYRGPAGHVDGECRASRWLSDAAQLGTLMSKIECRAGFTRIERVLRHALHEAGERQVHALVFVGDACEEDIDSLAQPAGALAQLGVPVFLFQEGDDRKASHAFRAIARITKGVHGIFDVNAAQQLGELLRAVAAFAVGGVTALEDSSNPAASKLLTALRAHHGSP